MPKTLVRSPPLRLLRGKNGKTLFNLRKAKNDDIETLKLRSIQNYKSLLECPTVTTLVTALTQKRSSKTNPNGCNCYVHDSRVCYFNRLLRIELNETIARKDVRFKPEPPPESFQLGSLHLRRAGVAKLFHPRAEFATIQCGRIPFDLRDRQAAANAVVLLSTVSTVGTWCLKKCVRFWRAGLNWSAGRMRPLGRSLATPSVGDLKF